MIKTNVHAIKKLIEFSMLALALASCKGSSDFVLDGAGTAGSSAGSTQAAALVISPALATLTVNGSLSFTATGGSRSYTFSVIAGSGSIGSQSGVYTAPGTAGTSTVRVTDSAGAIAESTVRINTVGGTGSTLAILPTSLTLTSSASYSFTASGGATPYSFSIVSGGGTINASSGIYSAPATTGNATVRVTDSQGSTSDCGVSVQQALAISPTSASVQVNNTRNFTASGGVGAYTYSVYSGVGSVNAGTGIYTASAGAGSAILKAQDSGGNSVYANITVFDALAISPSSATVATSSTKNFTASGGVGSYTYSIDSGIGSIDGSTGVYTAPAGTGAATVKVRDTSGNTSYASITVFSALTLTPGSTSVLVNGTKTFTGSGGVGTYTYSLFSGVGSVNSSSGIYTAPASAGNAVIRVTDSSSNVATANIAVFTPLVISPTSVKLAVGNNYTFSASGGVTPYSFSIPVGSGSIGASSGVFTAPGTSINSSIIRVSDAAGNSNDATVTTNPPVTLSPSSAVVYGGANQTFTATGGSESYTFAMVSGSGTINPSTGVFTAAAVTETVVLRATDTLNNTGTVSISVIDSPPPGACQHNDSFFTTDLGGCKDVTTGLVWSQAGASGTWYSAVWDSYTSSGSISDVDDLGRTNDQPPGANYYGVPDNDSSAYCHSLSQGSKADWRMPTTGELQAMASHSLAGAPPYINNIGASPYYWSSSPRVDYAYNGYVVQMSTGSQIEVGKQSAFGLVCVRGGRTQADRILIGSSAPTVTSINQYIPSVVTFQVKDSLGNSVNREGLVVTLNASAGSVGGTATATTDMTGVATFPASSWYLTTAGTVTVTATAPGGFASAAFTLRVGAFPNTCKLEDANYTTAAGGCKNLNNGLVWSKIVTGTMSWYDFIWDSALSGNSSPDAGDGGRTNDYAGAVLVADTSTTNYCHSLNEGGKTDWRAPSAGEIQSLFANGAVPANYLVGAGNLWVWSASQYNTSAGYSVRLNLQDGSTTYGQNTNTDAGAMCVRTGP